MNTNKGDTLIYCRVSERPEQADIYEDMQGRWQAALDLQRRQCEEFAVQFGYRVAGTCAEMFEGLSAESDGLNRLYALSADEAIRYVIVTDPSRLSFDKAARSRIVSRLAGLGVMVVYAAM